jgi:hypothetical protein
LLAEAVQRRERTARRDFENRPTAKRAVGVAGRLDAIELLGLRGNLPTRIALTSGGNTLLQLAWAFPSSPKNGNIASQLITAPSAALPTLLQQFYSHDQVNRISSEAENQASSSPASCSATAATNGDSVSQTCGSDAFSYVWLTCGALPARCIPKAACQTLASTAQFSGNQWTNSCSSSPCHDASGNQTALGGAISITGSPPITSIPAMAIGESGVCPGGAGSFQFFVSNSLAPPLGAGI